MVQDFDLGLCAHHLFFLSLFSVLLCIHFFQRLSLPPFLSNPLFSPHFFSYDLQNGRRRQQPNLRALVVHDAESATAWCIVDLCTEPTFWTIKVLHQCRITSRTSTEHWTKGSHLWNKQSFLDGKAILVPFFAIVNSWLNEHVLLIRFALLTQAPFLGSFSVLLGLRTTCVARPRSTAGAGDWPIERQGQFQSKQ